MLKSLVKQHTAAYFSGSQWTQFMQILNRGAEVRHAHVYVESILSPYDFAKVIQGWFEKNGYTLQRKIAFLSHGRGYANIYYIKPRADMAHFEVFMKFNDDKIIEPASVSNTRQGTNVEYWDDAYMDQYHAQFPFRLPTEEESQQLRQYFTSDHWTQVYNYMTVNGVHAHVPVETSIHPDSLLEIGKQALEAKRWEVDNAISVVYSLKGYDQGKITYLLKKPEIVLELDWEFNPDTLIRPRGTELMQPISVEDVHRDLDGIPYYRLDDRDIQDIIDRL